MTRAIPALLLLAVLAACAGGGEGAEERVTAEVAATVEPVQLQDFDETIDAMGAVFPRMGHVASLASPAPARISRVYVTVGSTVGAGDPLVAFEKAPFDAAAASAESALQAAEQSAARTRRLADAGVLPRKDAEAAAAELANARANALTARRARELSTLRAPFAGAVTRVSAVLGASVEPTQSLVDVADPRAVDVALIVSPDDAARARVGQEVALYVGASAGLEPVGHGRIGEVAAVVDSANGGVALRIAVSSTTRPLRFAEVLMGRVAVQRHAKAVTIPEIALVPTGEAFQVFVVDSAQVAHATAVTVGGRTAGIAWITRGLTGNERIVTKGAFGVDDGAKVVSGKP